MDDVPVLEASDDLDDGVDLAEAWKHRGFPKKASELVFFLFAPYY